MSALFRPGSQKEVDDQINPSQQHYKSAYTDAGVDQAEAFANDPTNATNELNDSEVDASKKLNEVEGGGGANWTNNVTSEDNQSEKKNIALQALGQARKRKGILGLIGVFGVSGGLLASFFGPASLVINLMENMVSTNDSTSTTMERRFMKAFGNMSSEDPICANNSKKSIRCKMGRISNSALYKLDKKGVKAVGYDGKRTGYPSKNPTAYTFSDGRTVQAKDLRGFLSQPENRKLASSVLGARGAFNMRVKAWIGNHITKKFYNKFGLTRSGGIADGKHSTTDGKTRYAATMEKLRANIPGLEAVSGVKDNINAKARSQMKKAGRGGVAYTTAVAGCMAVKAPGYVAAGVAAVQLAQILPFAMDIVLSPGSKAKAAGVGSGFSGDDMNAVGTTLTTQTPRESDGKMTSALDSAILLAAIGVNKGKPAVSTKFTPGYGVLKSGFFSGAQNVDNETKESCNVIMSPAAMYSAAAADAAVTVAASATIIGGVIKIVGSFALMAALQQVVPGIIASVSEEVIKEVAENDAIPQAEGEELGDILGISSAAFFSAGGMSRNLPTLSVDQAVAFESARKENEAFQREMDIASLSPFDTSSKYTFLGSIMNNLQFSMISSGAYNNNFQSIVSNIFSVASLSFANNASAATGYSSSYCGYADEFELGTGSLEGNTTPAVNVAGLPCTGMTDGQLNMETSEAVDLMASEGWIDEGLDIDIPDNATIDDLIALGYIKSETPLTDYIEACGDPTSGDYLFNTAGCMIDDSTPDTNITELSVCTNSVNAEGETIKTCASGGVVDDTDGEATTITPQGTPSQRALTAIPVFLLDYQMIQSINGEDEEVQETTSTNTSTATPLPTGTKQELATMIKDNTNVSDRTGQINQVASGSKTNVSDKVLAVVAALGEKNTFTISSFQRSPLSIGAGVYSWHTNGEAIDFSGSVGINGVRIPSFSAVDNTIRTFLIEVANTIQSSSCQIGVPNATYVKTVEVTGTSCNVFVDDGVGVTPHIHIGVKG